ncbi:xylulokinase [Hydrogenophaga soli]
MSCVLACDLGGTNFRASLIDEEGVVLAESVVPCPIHGSEVGWSEIEPELWWQALIHACGSLAVAEPRLFCTVEAVAICGVTRSQVFLDSKGQSLRPAIIWNDSRASHLAEQLAADVPEPHPELANLNAFHPLARLAWLRMEEGATFRKLATVLEPKDYLNFRLTGQRASDRMSMARLVAAAEQVQGVDLFCHIGTSTRILPTLMDPCAMVGTVSADPVAPFDRLVGRPVFCCSVDTWASALGLGALRPGVAFNVSGTTEVFGAMSPNTVSAQGLLCVDWGGLFQIGGPSQSGADTVRWLLSLLGQDVPESRNIGITLDALLELPRHPQALLFLPYLQGERVPYWDPALRGAFIGLQRQHRATDLAHAVLEGVAYLNRIVLDRAETALGHAVSEIRFGGGGASNTIWRQIKADVCERPVIVGASAQPGTLGAALVAWTGLGRFSSLEQAQDTLVKVASRYEPNPKKTEFHRRMFELFRQSESCLVNISHELVRIGAAV